MNRYPSNSVTEVILGDYDMTDTLVLLAVTGLGLFFAVVVIGFTLDVTLGRLLGLPRVFRRQGSGPVVVVGELSAIVFLMTATALECFENQQCPKWLLTVAAISFILAFIGQYESERQAGQSSSRLRTDRVPECGRHQQS